MNSYLLKNANLYRHHHFEMTDILIVDGKIEVIDKNIEGDYITYDLKGKLVSHNFIDMHVHLREPGYEHKETIATGSLSAMHGGYGTLVAMANTYPCMDTIEIVRDFQQRVQKDAHVNVFTYCAITKSLAGQELVDMQKLSQEEIVLGFSDDGKGLQNDDMMNDAMQSAKRNDTIIIAHCEDESELHGGCIHEGIYAQEHNLVGINSASEYQQVARDLDIVRAYHNRYHVCHISTKETVALLQTAQAEGFLVSGEVTPHHLILTEENIKDCHPNYKMNPPLRSKDDLQALIDGLNNKTIEVIATDHAPHTKEEKMTTIQNAPFGIIGIQHAFSLLYTYLVKKDKVSLPIILDALTCGPAKILKLDAEIVVGKTANLCIIDLDERFCIEENDILSKSCNTPFIGVQCQAKVMANIINGCMHELEVL